MKKILSVAAIAAFSGVASAMSPEPAVQPLTQSNHNATADQAVSPDRVAGACVWDTMYPTQVTGTGSTPRTFIGAAVDSVGNAAGSGPIQLTGLDCNVANFNTTPLVMTQLRLNMFFWGGYGTGTAPTDLVFTNSLATASVDFTLPGGSLTLPASNFITFGAAMGAAPNAATAGIDLTSLNITLPNLTGLAGVTFNWQCNTGAGLGNNAGLTSTMIGNNGTTLIAGPQTIGVSGFALPTGGFFRNASGLLTGNFQNGDARSFTGITNTAVAFRLYGTAIPTPGAAGLVGVAGLVSLRRRRA